jgi:hypothetical protein
MSTTSLKIFCVLPLLILLTIGAFGEESYFPKGLPSDFELAWFGTDLKSLQEKSMYPPSDKTIESYRVLSLPSFHDRTCVRIERDGNKYRLTLKRLQGPGNAEALLLKQSTASEVLKEDKTKDISEGEWNKLLGLIEKSKFWSLKSHDDRIGLDGTTWVIEGARAGKYHMVERWSPKDGPIFELGNYIQKLAGTNFEMELDHQAELKKGP